MTDDGPDLDDLIAEAVRRTLDDLLLVSETEEYLRRAADEGR